MCPERLKQYLHRDVHAYRLKAKDTILDVGYLNVAFFDVTK